MDKEDGEMSDDNAMLIDNDDHPDPTDTKTKITTEEDCTVLYKAEKNGLVVKRLQKVDATKLEERAKRFGLNLTGNRVITQTQIDELYANFGIESGNERHFRFDALYLHGVDGLTTKEIFEYLEDYKPLSLEWIDDVSCNVVCQDHISAALALLVHSREIKNKVLKEMLGDQSNHHWREGMPHPKQDLILIRFATNGEKKKLKKNPETKNLDQYYDKTMDSSSKNPWGDLCKSWGVYDHQEVFIRKLPKNDYEDEIDEVIEPRKPIQIRNKKLAMRLGKRRQDNADQSDESGSDSEWKLKSKAPRMRMHADDEESKQKKKQVSKPIKSLEQDQYEKYAPLSIEVVNSQNTYVKKEHTKLSDKFKFHGGNKQSSIRSRLGEKVVPSDEKSSQSEASNDESSDGDSDHNLMSKVQKVDSKASAGSVWSRLETQQRQTSGQSDLRQILKSRSKLNKSHSNDLRDRLGKSKPANLRIEIDNNRYSDDDD